jgi:hypothetical protein
MTPAVSSPMLRRQPRRALSIGPGLPAGASTGGRVNRGSEATGDARPGGAE